VCWRASTGTRVQDLPRIALLLQNLCMLINAPFSVAAATTVTVTAHSHCHAIAAAFGVLTSFVAPFTDAAQPPKDDSKDLGCERSTPNLSRASGIRARTRSRGNYSRSTRSPGRCGRVCLGATKEHRASTDEVGCHDHLFCSNARPGLGWLDAAGVVHDRRLWEGSWLRKVRLEAGRTRRSRG